MPRVSPATGPLMEPPVLSVALLSGGLDSTVATTLAAREGRVVLAVTVDYGQRARRREIGAARTICEGLGLRHEVLDARWLAREPGGALTGEGAVPEPGEGELEGPAAERSAEAVWVPNRNGLLVNMAATRAEALGASHVVVGFNAEEGATFPDNSEAFLEAADRALALSTRRGVTLWAPLIDLDKEGIVRRARQVGAPLQSVWPCYGDGERPCERCESCRRFLRGLERAGLLRWYKGLLSSPR